MIGLVTFIGERFNITTRVDYWIMFEDIAMVNAIFVP